MTYSLILAFARVKSIITFTRRRLNLYVVSRIDCLRGKRQIARVQQKACE